MNVNLPMTVCTNVTTQLETTPVTVMISLRLINPTAKAASVSNLSFFFVCEPLYVHEKYRQLVGKHSSGRVAMEITCPG